VGDLVTVQIIENSRGPEKSVPWRIKNRIFPPTSKPPTHGNSSSNTLGLKVTNDTKAETGLERRGSLVAAVTARVTEVMPDGNLRIEAEQEIVLEGRSPNHPIKGNPYAPPISDPATRSFHPPGQRQNRIQIEERTRPPPSGHPLLDFRMGVLMRRLGNSAPTFFVLIP
jgi:hypothetical protein